MKHGVLGKLIAGSSLKQTVATKLDSKIISAICSVWMTDQFVVNSKYGYGKLSCSLTPVHVDG